MLLYKALYRKLMDGLKDCGMWLDWAEQLKADFPEVAQFLCDSAKSRLEDDYTKTYEWFEKVCAAEKGRDGSCLNEMVEDHMTEWYESMLNRAKKFTT